MTEEETSDLGMEYARRVFAQRTLSQGDVRLLAGLLSGVQPSIKYGEHKWGAFT